MFWWEKIIVVSLGIFLFDRWVVDIGLSKKKSKPSPKEDVGKNLDLVGGYGGGGGDGREKSEREAARERRENELRKGEGEPVFGRRRNWG